MNIQLLAPEVIDQIAAGEVLERPANLVKELIENSIDAKATEIEIDISEGGRSLKITDNGHGISQTDLPLALARHATSKIQKGDDLWNLGTYGFRGEALASSSAVSQLTLLSRKSNSNEGHRLESQFGKLTQVEPVSHAQGTSVLIQNLFENVPARKKFLKSDSAEITQIKKIIKAMALANHGVTFRVRVQGKVVFFYNGTKSFLQRAKDVLQSSSLHSVEVAQDGFCIRVAFSSPHEVQGNGQNLWFFVNGRWVQDRTMQAATFDAYQNLLMHGEYPIVSLWLEVPKDFVDVNVHPAKSQVKFMDNSLIFRLVQKTLRDELQKSPWLKDAVENYSANFLKQDVQLQSAESQSFREQNYSTQYAINKNLADKNFELPNMAFKDSTFLRTQLPQKEFASAGSYLEQSQLVSETMLVAEGFWSRLNVLAQLQQTYILAQSEKSFFMIDQHAAHERVNFEKLKSVWLGGSVSSQELLIPLRIEMDESAIEALFAQKESLEKLGIRISQAGPQEIAVESYFSLLKESAVTLGIQKLAQQLSEQGGGSAIENVILDVIATMACHSSVRAGQSLSLEEMRSLLNQMDEFSLSSFCPHGRPVYIEKSFSQIERDFGRIV